MKATTVYIRFPNIPPLPVQSSTHRLFWIVTTKAWGEAMAQDTSQVRTTKITVRLTFFREARTVKGFTMAWYLWKNINKTKKGVRPIYHMTWYFVELMRFASGSCSCNFPVALVFVFTTRNQKRFTIKVLRADKWANLKFNVLPPFCLPFHCQYHHRVNGHRHRYWRNHSHCSAHESSKRPFVRRDLVRHQRWNGEQSWQQVWDGHVEEEQIGQSAHVFPPCDYDANKSITWGWQDNV